MHHQDEYSKKIQESLVIFSLLEDQIKDCLIVLERHKQKEERRIAIKSLCIDICSFIDEVNKFASTLRKSKNSIKNINTFLLVSFSAKRLLNDKQENIKNYRNKIHAHNFRDIKGIYINPFDYMSKNFEEFPIKPEELILLGNVCLLVIDLAHNFFMNNDDMAFTHLKKAYAKFFNVLQYENKRNANYLHDFRKEIYSIKGALKSHDENYQLIAKKLGCRLVQDKC
jgi:hypothetical protein